MVLGVQHVLCMSLDSVFFPARSIWSNNARRHATELGAVSGCPAWRRELRKGYDDKGMNSKSIANHLESRRPCRPPRKELLHRRALHESPPRRRLSPQTPSSIHRRTKHSNEKPDHKSPYKNPANVKAAKKNTLDSVRRSVGFKPKC